MGQVMGDLLPMAVGVALSPVPIIAVILMLGTPRARSNGPAFAVGWVLGLVIVSIIVLLVASGSDDTDSGSSTAVDVIKLLLGVLFLLMAIKQWQARPKAGEEPEMPKWMAAIDRCTVGKSFLLGVALSGVNPKNLALTLAAAASIAQAGLSGGETTIAVAVGVGLTLFLVLYEFDHIGVIELQATPDRSDVQEAAPIEGLLILRPDGRLYTANVRGVSRRILAAVDSAHTHTVIVDVSAAPMIPVTVLDEFVDLQRELDARRVSLWVAALSPRALETARKTPGWATAEAAGRVFPTSLAAAKAYIGAT